MSSDELRERLKKAVLSHDIDETRIDWWNEQDPYCVCGEQVKSWDEHWIDAAAAELLPVPTERDALKAANDAARTRVRLHLSEVEGQERVRKVVGQMDAEDLRKILADLGRGE